MKRLISALQDLLNSPRKMLFLSGVLVFSALILDGTLFHLWKLYKNHDELQTKIETSKERTEILDVQIQKAKDPIYIQQQARDRFDFVAEDEIVFVFSKGD